MGNVGTCSVVIITLVCNFGECTSTLEDGENNDSIYIDFTKYFEAFETVLHQMSSVKWRLACLGCLRRRTRSITNE